MINHISNLLSIKKTIADFTSWICVAAPVWPYCQNIHYFLDLQQLFHCPLSATDTKNMSNQRIVMLSAVLVSWENRAIPH